jgi:hypothetical protein
VRHSTVVTNDSDKPRVYRLYYCTSVVAEERIEPGMSGGISWQGLSVYDEDEWHLDYIEVTDKPLFEWQVVKEARRQLGFATNAGERRAAQLLDGLLAAHPEADIDTGQLVNCEGATMEHVVYHAAMIAAERFNPDPADPGWTAEMHEDALREACLAYAQAFLARRNHGG